MLQGAAMFEILHDIQNNPHKYSLADLWAALDMIRHANIDPGWKAMVLRMLSERIG
jgi:hypothetical protein